MYKLYSKLQFVVLVIVSILCNIQVFLEFRMENMKKKLFLWYQYIKSFEKKFLVLVYVTLLNYESVNFLFTSSQHFHVISKYRNSRGGSVRGGSVRNPPDLQTSLFKRVSSNCTLQILFSTSNFALLSPNCPISKYWNLVEKVQN